MNAVNLLQTVSTLNMSAIQPAYVGSVLTRKSEVDAATTKLLRTMRQKSMILRRIAVIEREDQQQLCTAVNPTAFIES